MANKPFSIQEAKLRIGGVDLEAGDTSVVIPGVTQATNSRVVEVEDSGDQTLWFETPPYIIDYITWEQWNAFGSPNGAGPFAEYTATLDEDGYIDNIEVTSQGSYSTNAVTNNEGNDVYIYTGNAPDMFSPFVGTDWTHIPFRPKMRAGAIETIGGGGGGSGTINKVYYQYSTDIIVSVNTGDNSVTVNGDITNSLNDSEYITLSVVPPQVHLAASWEYESGSNQTVITFDSEDIEVQSGYVGEEVRTIYVYNNPTSLIFDDTVATYQTNGAVSIHGTPTQLFKGGESLAIMDTGDIIIDGIGTGGVNRGIEWKYGENNNGINSKLRQDNDGLTVRAYTVDGGDISAPVNIVTNQDANQKTWVFDGDGALTFPDGTVQTTAYTGQSSGGNTTTRFVMVNDAGTVTGSSDGLIWGTLFDTGLQGINRVAVGPVDIVYIGDNSSTYHTTAWNITPTLVSDPAPSSWRQVRYYENIGRFVAVGNILNVPHYKHSTNGLVWTYVSLDTGWANTLNGGDGPGPAEFTDIATNGTGFLITSNNTTLGSFYTTTLTTNTNIGATDWLNDGMKFDRTFYTPYGGFTGWWAFGNGNTSAGDGWWLNTSANPANGSFTTSWGGMSDISQTFTDRIGYEAQWSEVTAGTVNGVDTIAFATNDGQVLYWPILPAGPYVSIPKPYTAIVDNITNASPATIIFTGEGKQGTVEKLTITGSSVTGYNGTYFINGANQLFLDQALTSPFNTNTLDPFTGTATLTWFHGQFIDALDFVNGKLYAGNDDEEIFVSSDAGATWTQVASLTGVPGQGEGLGYMNDIDGYVGTNSAITSMSYYDGDEDYTSTVDLTKDFNVDVKYSHANINADGSWELGSDHFDTKIFSLDEQGPGFKDVVISAGSQNNNWMFGRDGTLSFPDGTVQKTALKDFNRSWATIIGDGVNDAGTDNNYGSAIRMNTVYAMPDGSVVAGGSWQNDDNALLFHFDKNGRELWRWMDIWSSGSGSSDSRVSSITYDTVNNKLIVAIRGRWGFGGASNYSTRVYKFTRHPENFGKWNYWQCDDSNNSDSLNIRDGDQTGDAEVYQILTQNGNIVALGESYGEKFEAYSGSAVSGSGVGIISIAKVDITPYNNLYPGRDDGWTITYNGGTYDLNWNNLGRYTAVPWTTNNAGAGATLQVYVDYNTGAYTVQITGGTLTGWVTGDIITILGTDVGGTSPANDLNVTVTDDGNGGINSLGTPTGTANTAYIRINNQAWFNDLEDHTLTGYTYVLNKPINSEAFMLNDYNEWTKRLSTAGYGRFSAGVHNSDENAWFIGGETWDSDGVSQSITRVSQTGSIVWNKGFTGRASDVQGMTDTGTSIWVVDLMGLVMELDYDGTVLYQSQIDENEYGMNYDYGTTNIKYIDGYIYVGGHINTWGWGNNQIRVEKINATTKQVVWCRHIKSRFANVNYDQQRYKYMDANESGVFVIGHGYMGANDNRHNGFIIKLDLENPPGANVDYLDNKSEPNLNGWFIFDKYDGSEFANWRVTSEYTVGNRTKDTWLDSEMAMYGGESISQTYPRWSLRHTSIDTQGVSFNDNTGDLRHNPAYVPPIETEWVNNNYAYTLKLEDAGKFIRTIPYDASNCTIWVPNDSQANFPIGTVITLINMHDYSNTSVYMYINSQSDPDGQNFDNYDQPFIYLAGGNGYSPSWGLKGVGTATLMKVGRNEWLLTGNCVNTD